MFGLSNGHAAGALAMVMVGTALYVAPGQPLMSDEVMNAIVMLILFSCIISSFATEHAAKELALHAETGTQQTQDEEKIMIALHNPSTVSSLVALALIGAGVSVFLIPWLKKQTTEAQRKELTAWVKIGVAAAEQLYVGQGRGEEKKQYVLDFLKQKGFKVDEESVVNAIEAIVKQLNTEGLTIE